MKALPKPPVIQTKDLACGYHGRTVLHNINLSAAPGDVVVLLGPNGSGKSTLLKTIARLLPALSGSVQLMDQPINSFSFQELARAVAVVPQDEHETFPFTAAEVVMMGRYAHSSSLLDSEEDVEIVSEALRAADCEPFADRPVQELSGGEKQRVWLARALAQRAPVILLDEPSSHLDVAHQVSLSNLIGQLAKEGKTILIAVHDINFASQLATRALLLDQGSAVSDGPIEDVLGSAILEEVYGVSFEALRDSGGRTRLFPRSGRH